MKHHRFKIAVLAALTVICAGLLPPEEPVIPVEGASPADWNHDTFWHAPWGASGVHKGIDIFAAEGTAVLAAASGPVLFRGTLGRGGTVVISLGPKWRFHYYAHLSRADVRPGEWLARSAPLGAVGTTGNAAGKPPHLHYSVVTALPYPWRFRLGPQGWLRPVFLNPHDLLTAR